MRRLEPLLLLVLPLAWGALLFAPGYSTDPDAYYHVGVARRLVEQGWIRTFDWLPWTRLHDPFPDLYLGQHLVLAPLVWAFGPALALRLGTLLLASALALSLHRILARRGVAAPSAWIVGGMLAVPLTVAYSLALKGAATFFVLLVWFVDAVLAERTRWVFGLALLSVYVYVGAPVLIPLVVVHLVVVRARERRWGWRPAAATAGGLAVGMLANPFWPGHWGYVAAELRSVFERGAAMTPGVFRGAEWNEVTGSIFVLILAPVLVSWFVLLLRQLARSAPLPVAETVLAVCVLGLLGGGLLSGTKLLAMAALFSLLAVPLVATAMRPWPRATPPVAALVAAAFIAVNARDVGAGLLAPGRARPAEYQAMGRWIVEHSAPTEVIVCAWDDFPGFFAFGGEQRYVAGWNTQFLADADPRRFQAYLALFDGRVGDPERLLPTYFDDARLVIVYRDGRHSGEVALAASLAQSPHFEELAAPVPLWRIFRLRR